MEQVTLCEIISLEHYYRYGYRLLLLELTSRLLILIKKFMIFMPHEGKAIGPMCLTMIYPRPKNYLYYPKFHIVEVDLLVPFLYEVFEAPSLLGELTMEASFGCLTKSKEMAAC